VKREIFILQPIEKILAFDESSLAGLWGKYKNKMEQFDTTKKWEKAVIIFFIINSVRVKTISSMSRSYIVRKTSLTIRKPRTASPHI